MVGVVGNNHPLALGDGSGDSPGQIVRLTTRVREEDDIESFGEHPAETVGVFDNIIHQVAGVGVEDGCLACNCVSLILLRHCLLRFTFHNHLNLSMVSTCFSFGKPCNSILDQLGGSVSVWPSYNAFEDSYIL